MNPKRRKKFEAVALLVAEGNAVDRICEIAGISRSTFFRLQRQPAFQKLTEELQSKLFVGAIEKLCLLAGKAVATLENLLDTGTEQTRLRACGLILANVGALKETAEVEVRLLALEKKIRENPVEKTPGNFGIDGNFYAN